ncbi:MAG: efflux RND transporter periplasmic adaptor subunit [Bacteroidota bacterium]
MKRITALYFIGTAFFFSCSSSPTPEAETAASEKTETMVALTQEEFKQAAIAFGKVETRVISNTIQASGMLDVPPTNKVSVSAPMQGVVKTTSVLQGSHVSKGEVIVELQHADYIQLQQDYLDYAGQLDFLESEFKRQTDLATEQVSSQKTAQQAKAAYNSTLAKIQGLKAKLQLIGLDPKRVEKEGIQSAIKIKSPISGYVTNVNINMGSHVTPDEVMLVIVNTEHLHAELTIFEKDIMQIRVGQKVLFTLGNETAERSAEVHLIGREIRPDRSVQIHCHIDKEDKQLIPGTYLKARIETTNQPSPVLPDGAIVGFEGNDFVFVETAPLSFEMVTVEKGNTENGFTVIVSSGKPLHNAKVVTKGAYSLMGKLKNTEGD